MAALNARVIHAPSDGVLEMLNKRLTPTARTSLDTFKFNCVALINTSIPNIFYYADRALKSGAVFAAELSGTCPQHITTLALFGEVSAVMAAMDTINREAEK